MSLFKAFMLVALAIILIYQQVLIMDLRWQFREFKARKPAFYTVTDRGKQLLMVQIK